jgi:hypothetical protein
MMPAPRRLVPQRWVAPLLLIVAVGLVPWTLLMAFRLPAEHTSHHWDAAWVGFDVGLVLALVATGYGLLRRSPWLGATAVVAATMLLTDAWFDNLLASGHDEHLEAALEAAVGELPLALVCIWIAVNAERASAAVRAATGQRPSGR